MSRYAAITGWVLVGVAVALIVYDTFAAAYWGVDATESVVILTVAHRHPIIPFAFGVLCGHFFWSQKAESYWDKTGRK